MQKILFATSNENKLREARQILKVEIEGLALNLDEVQTLDPVECAQKKAKAAFKLAKQPVLVEDTALFFTVWNGLPGVFIDYFMKTVGNPGLIKLMKTEQNRAALAQTTLCYFDGNKLVTATGKIDGEIALQERGENGFGWDSIFIPKSYEKTFAELGSTEKNKFSMRRLAFEELKKQLAF